jgi:hypothetical protein
LAGRALHIRHKGWLRAGGATTIERTRKRFKGWATLLATGFAVALLAPAHVAASGCSRDPGNAAATAAAVGAVRAACPCASFTTRAAHRRCVRAVVADAVSAGALATSRGYLGCVGSTACDTVSGGIWFPYRR